MSEQLEYPYEAIEWLANLVEDDQFRDGQAHNHFFALLNYIARIGVETAAELPTTAPNANPVTPELVTPELVWMAVAAAVAVRAGSINAPAQWANIITDAFIARFNK